jgi:magnesium transporter
VRIVEDANVFHDRVTALLDAHLSFTSNRLNQVMKTLTVISTIFLPLTVLTGMFGMNVALLHFPGGDTAQFWWICGLMATIAGVMLWYFNRASWR